MDTEFDVIIIGAGINGAGIARDAAMRGLKVLLIDKADIGSGTSSWSTRLIHGGLRYLEHAEFGLVRESLRERDTLMRIAPHLVRPIPILTPIYKGARRGPWTIHAGMLAYDLLSFRKNLPRHRMLSRANVLQIAPGLNPTGLKGGAIYYDAQVEFAERLVLENVLSAVENGAVVITYSAVTGFIVQNEKICAVEITDQIADDGVQIVKGRMVINAAGPWVDEVLETGPGNRDRLIGGTKGSHIIVGPFEGAPDNAVYVEAESDGRPFFVIPWNDKYLIGTTDIRFDGDLDRVSIDEAEITYLLQETNRVVPEAALTREHILYTYSGVRPLPFTTKTDEQSITRRHFIRQHATFRNLISIVGGKLTTYRSLAEETVDLVGARLGKPKSECKTSQVPLPGNVINTLRDDNVLASAQAERTIRVYGQRATRILDLVRDEPALAIVLDEETGAVGAEVVFAFKEELAQTLADCLLRRTMVGLNSTCGLNCVEAAAEVGRKYLGWSQERTAREIANYQKQVQRLQSFRSAL